MTQRLYTTVFILVIFVAQARLYNGSYTDLQGNTHEGMVDVVFVSDRLAPWNQSKIQFIGPDGVKVKLTPETAQDIVAGSYHFQAIDHVRRHSLGRTKKKRFLLVSNIEGKYKLYHWLYYQKMNGFVEEYTGYYIVTPKGETYMIKRQGWKSKIKSIFGPCGLTDLRSLTDYENIENVILWARVKNCE